MASYIVEQKITAFANQYRVFEANGEQKGALVAFVHQKRLSLRENILFYSDEDKAKLAFQLKTQNVMELAATYEIYDDQNKLLGRLRKNFSSSLLRSTWAILGPKGDDPLATVRERSVAKAIARRVWGLVPYLGDFPFFLKYHFDFLAPDGKALGSYDKTSLFLDHYRLELDDSFLKQIDWRVAVAMGVSLDALQSR